MNVFFFGNTTKDNNYLIGNKIIAELKELGFNVYVDQIQYSSNANMIEDFKIIDLSIILGGDGTIINYARKYNMHSIPFMGINLGRVGALAVSELDNYKKYLLKIKNNDYHIEKRMVLEGVIEHSDNSKTEFVAFNDITLHRYQSLKMLGIKARLNDSHENIIYADGVVISTPTGSTAYSLSCGGPLLLPTTKCFVLTPICPQFKAYTPVVIDDCHTISLSILSEYESTRLGIDGCESYNITSKDIISISKSQQSLEVITFEPYGDLFGSLFKVAMAFNKK